MRYLLFAEFEANPTDDDTMRFQYEVFLDHSAKYWAAHIRESYIDVDSTATQSMLRLCDTSSTCCQTWFRLYWTSTNTEFSENFAVLMIASYLFGPTTVVKHLLLQLDSTDLNCKDSTHGRYNYGATFSAIQKNHEPVVKLLLETGKLNPDTKDMNGRTPLRGNVEIIQYLLKKWK
jgi:ankyrin repeat domain-containing protein 50